MAKVYLETTIPSYLAGRSSRDLIVAAHQQITSEWWDQREKYDLYVSQLVLREVSSGDEETATRLLQLIEDIPMLELTEEAVSFASELIAQGALPEKAAVDALHIAVAVKNGMDYLLTWNCTHIANAPIRGTIEYFCRSKGYEPPIICTPEELMES